MDKGPGKLVKIISGRQASAKSTVIATVTASPKNPFAGTLSCCNLALIYIVWRNDRDPQLSPVPTRPSPVTKNEKIPPWTSLLRIGVHPEELERHGNLIKDVVQGKGLCFEREIPQTIISYSKICGVSDIFRLET